ncbi:MAG: VWA domain-containing protein [Opitutales bacterium]
MPQTEFPSNAVVKKKRGAVFIVIVASVAAHVLVGGVLAAIKVVEVLQKEAEFEAPPLEAAEPPPPPPPPPPTTQRTQKSMPRPQPLAAQNPQNLDVPAIEIDKTRMNMLSGRGFGGGLGQVGGGVLDTFNMDFFGMEMSGNDVVFVIDMSGSMILKQRGIDGYEVVAKEVEKALEEMQGVKFNVIAFGGTVDVFERRFVTADRRSIEEASKFLRERDPRNTQPEGATKVDRKHWRNYKDGRHTATHAGEALKEAFELNPGLVIFLSDGNPNGEMKQDEIFEMVEQYRTDVSPVVINTMSYKSKNGREFLERLAEISEGEFTKIN